MFTSDLTQNEKRTIAARIFFEENRKDYEDDFGKALTEFSAEKGIASDDFVSTVIQWNLELVPEHFLMFNPRTGVVANVTADGHLILYPTIPEEDIRAIIKSVESMATNIKDAQNNTDKVMCALGWRYIKVFDEEGKNEIKPKAKAKTQANEHLH